MYPPAEDGDPWRAVFPENGRRRFRESGTEGWPRSTGSPGPLRARPKVAVGGSALLVDPAEIPSSGDVGGLGRALAAGSGGWRDELMVYLAAYSGMGWGELVALTIGQVALTARGITVDRRCSGFNVSGAGDDARRIT